MKLERIELENFRQYFRQQQLTFSKDPQRNVTVIHGINGAGKSGLFYAINWCLYGGEGGVPGELLSKEAISRAAEGETVTAKVDLVFSHEGERYRLSRTISVVKQGDGSVTPGNSDLAMVRIRLDGNSQNVNNPVGRINSFLPSTVRAYFLFDSEKIDSFAKLDQNDEVKPAIYNVLKLELLVRAKKHLTEIADEYRKVLRTVSSGELGTIVAEKDEKIAKRDEAVCKKEQAEREIESARSKVRDIERRQRELDKASALQAQREGLEREMFQRQADRDQVETDLREIVMSCKLIAARPALEAAAGVLEQKRRRGEIPSNIRRQFIETLLEDLSCVCGRPFEKDGPEYDRLTRLVDSSLPGSLEDEIIEEASVLPALLRRAQELKPKLDSAMDKRVALTDTISELTDKLDDVSRQLAKSPEEEVRRLEKQRQEYQADIERRHMDISRYEDQIVNLSNAIADLEHRQEKAAQDKTRERLLTQREALATHAAEAIDQRYQAFADQMRLRIEAKCKEIFKLLVWKETQFQDVRLGPDYQLEVIDRYGTAARPDLSAGERQVLSLSFITAMSRVSEEEAPLVIDTPFGRLSASHRDSITDNLPKLADQLVLFVTDQELDGKARENLEPRIGAEYKLEFNDDTGCTEIVEVSK